MTPWSHPDSIGVGGKCRDLKFTTLKLGVSRLPFALLSLWKAFTWYILAPINSTSPFFLPANDLRSYLGLRAVELGMGHGVHRSLLFCIRFRYVCRKHCMGFFVGVRLRVSLFFRFVQWLTYSFVRDQQAQYVIAYWFCDENGQVGEFVPCDLGILTPNPHSMSCWCGTPRHAARTSPQRKGATVLVREPSSNGARACRSGGDANARVNTSAENR